MLTTYLIASSLLFTVGAFASCMQTSTPPSAPGAAICACIACFGWVCTVVRIVG